MFWQGERGRPRDGSKVAANQRPTRSLFVINFDPIRTRVRDIERHFEPYGKILNVRIRRNFAFVQFENQEDATKALECTHMRLSLHFFLFAYIAILCLLCVFFLFPDKKCVFGICSEILDRVVSVEYALRDDGERGYRYDSPRRDYGRHGDSPYRRSPSPMYRRGRPSPDYGRPHSPTYDKHNGSSYDRYRSPEYGSYRR